VSLNLLAMDNKIVFGVNKQGVSYEYNTEIDVARCYQIVEGVEFEKEFFKPTLKLIKEITLVDLIEQE
jgi:hypothetical protein